MLFLKYDSNRISLTFMLHYVQRIQVKYLGNTAWPTLHILKCLMSTYTGHFVMVPLNLTHMYLHCLQHSFFKHLFTLYLNKHFQWKDIPRQWWLVCGWWLVCAWRSLCLCAIDLQISTFSRKIKGYEENCDR